MFKYTKHTLKKIEELFSAIEYTVRYEKGSFQSGYCIVEHRKIAVINKFFDVEARINCLLEILSTIEVEEEQLDEKKAEFYKKLRKLIQQEETEQQQEKAAAEVVEETTENQG